MKRIYWIISGVGLLVALLGLGYYAVLREPEAPSAPIEAAPLDSPHRSGGGRGGRN